MSKMGTQKNNKKQAAKKSSTLPKLSQIGDPGGHQSSTKLKSFRNFLHPGFEMGQESSRGPKKVARGVQKVPKGFQKVATSHEKDIQKASTRHPNAISKCIGNSVGNSISNAIAFASGIPVFLNHFGKRDSTTSMARYIRSTYKEDHK